MCSRVFPGGKRGDPRHNIDRNSGYPGVFRYGSHTPCSHPLSGQPGELAYNVALTGYEPDSIPVPGKGIFIKVIYRGASDGKYTTGNETEELRNSGERVFEIENPGTTITATVKNRKVQPGRH